MSLGTLFQRSGPNNGSGMLKSLERAPCEIPPRCLGGGDNALPYLRSRRFRRILGLGLGVSLIALTLWVMQTPLYSSQQTNDDRALRFDA